MDDILNIDECLSDSFSLSSDTDIRNIVDQWKCSGFSEENKDPKIFDTRTFTRPKKRLFSGSDVNSTFSKQGSSIGQGNDAAAINLQIGGLVTSMQRSFLGDISPPVSVLVADTSLGNSLITSSDFTNIDEYFNGEEDTLNSSQFNRYTLQDVVKDRNFLEKLTAYDDSLFTKDADIEKIDVNQLLGNSSGNSTLQSSMSSSSHTTKADETFTPDGNATFNATIGDANRTYLQIVNSSQQNATFNANAGNATFDAQRNQKPTVPFDNRTEDLLDDESMILSETFGIVDRTFNGNATVDLPINGYLLQSPLCSPLTKTFPTATEDVLASTPSRQLSTHYSNIKNTTISKMDIDNISPISCEEFKFDKHLRGNCTYSNSPTIEALQQINVRRNKTNSNLGILNLRDEERRSLTNFEEFENTLSLLENNQDEAELDDLLNSIGHVPQLKNEKIRQSLDNIKKRHSLINLEKQQLDEQKRLEVSMHRGGIGETTAIIDRQRMNDSINKLMMSSSGSGERLLRRSRLNDDAMMNISSEAKAMNKSAVLNETITQSTEANNRTMNMEELHSGGDNRLTNTNNTYSQNETYKTESNETEHNEPEVDRSNRDRFKTIRIFKRPPENAKMVPDIDDSQSVENIPSENQYDITQANEHFTAKNTNSPKLIADAAAEANDTRRSSSVSGLKRSALVRPKYLSGIAKRETSTRSSSQEILSSNDSAEQNMERKPAETLKSPMGVKAKSIHNLASSTSRYTISHGNQRDSRPASRDLSLTRTTINGSGNVDLNKGSSGNTFKVPQTKLALRQPTIKKLTLVRPSSGYYSMNAKRNDSDTESGRFSSNNSLSSGSSRGSLYNKQETSDLDVTQKQERYATTIEPKPVTSSGLNAPKAANGIAKPSGLRPPSNIKRSGLPRPSGIPKR